MRSTGFGVCACGSNPTRMHSSHSCQTLYAFLHLSHRRHDHSSCRFAQRDGAILDGSGQREHAQETEGQKKTKTYQTRTRIQDFEAFSSYSVPNHWKTSIRKLSKTKNSELPPHVNNTAGIHEASARTVASTYVSSHLPRRMTLANT